MGILILYLYFYLYKKMAASLSPIKTTNLKEVINTTFDGGKIPFIIDTAGVVAVFLKYSGKPCEVGEMAFENITGGGNYDIGEEMRKVYVGGARYGGTVMFHMGQTIPEKWKEFCSTDSQKFNQDVIFDCKKNRERSHFAKIVKPEEDEDRFGNTECTPNKENFRIVIVVDVEDKTKLDQVLKDAKAKFPNFDANFKGFLNS